MAVKWPAWLQRFPTAVAVASAPLREVLVAWQGMGYNNRAVRLKQCCEHVAAHGWPRSVAGLEELPGIGKYTAHAIACFAFGQRVAVVDVNVKLVYAPFTKDAEAWAVAEKMLPRRRWYDYNQALFDLGTVIRSSDLSSLPPSLKELYADRPRVERKRAEKLYRGIPMRLYRGALVQLLRESDGHAATFAQCAAHISAKLASQPVPFVLQVARRLENDGVVTVHGATVRLA
jgi:A/G-specific adenine glycosylase